jgi:hypothetical protein
MFELFAIYYSKTCVSRFSSSLNLPSELAVLIDLLPEVLPFVLAMKIGNNLIAMIALSLLDFAKIFCF